ncbi:hypothetical protein Skr01_18480 [Sphaerisporangium krabiense]|nr:hypothetical protein Skr01_18480 [Sphaerisporangium krabiense]
MIVHPGGLRTTYLPVRASVRRGEVVRSGDVIGSVEPATRHCPASCLHWGLIRGARYLDALLLLGLGQVRLLPRWLPTTTRTGTTDGPFPQ